MCQSMRKPYCHFVPNRKKITTCSYNATGDIILGTLILECAMRTNTNLQPNQSNKGQPATSGAPALVWFGGVVVRTLFLMVLIVITARVASPQIERFSSLYETPGDLVRV